MHPLYRHQIRPNFPDFGGSDAAVIRHLLRYADEPLAESLKGIRGVSDDGYDWILNDAAP